jgi:hypothetical protein
MPRWSNSSPRTTWHLVGQLGNKSTYPFAPHHQIDCSLSPLVAIFGTIADGRLSNPQHGTAIATSHPCAAQGQETASGHSLKHRMAFHKQRAQLEMQTHPCRRHETRCQGHSG